MGPYTVATLLRPCCRKRSILCLSACGSSAEKIGLAAKVLRGIKHCRIGLCLLLRSLQRPQHELLAEASAEFKRFVLLRRESAKSPAESKGSGQVRFSS